MNGKHNDFNKIFYILALFHIFYFYIVPLVIISNFEHSIVSVYNYSISDNKIIFAIISLVVFIFGFIFIDTIKFFNKNFYSIDISVSKYENKSVRFLFFILLIFYTLFLIYQFMDSSRTEEIYATKSGQAESNLLQFFISNIVSTIKLALLLVIIKIYSKKYVLLFLFLSLLVEFYGGIGRFNLILYVMVVMIVFFDLKAIKVSLFLFIALLFGLPIVFQLKSIIYLMATGSLDFSRLIFDFNYTLYINNFGHPLISIITVENLVDSLGYRYFYDYLHGFLFYLKLFGLDFGASITYYNTNVLLNIFESVVPIGYLAFGYLQLSYFGIFFSGIFYRLMGSLAKYVLKRYDSSSESTMFLFAFISANSFYHGEVRVMVMTIFFPFLITIILSNLLLKNRESNI